MKNTLQDKYSIFETGRGKGESNQEVNHWGKKQQQGSEQHPGAPFRVGRSEGKMAVKGKTKKRGEPEGAKTRAVNLQHPLTSRAAELPFITLCSFQNQNKTIFPLTNGGINPEGSKRRENT
jgi:hypothetical protein